MQSGDGVSQPFGECVRSDAVVDGAKFLHIVLADDFTVFELKFLGETFQLFDFFESVHNPAVCGSMLGATLPEFGVAAKVRRPSIRLSDKLSGVTTAPPMATSGKLKLSELRRNKNG